MCHLFAKISTFPTSLYDMFITSLLHNFATVAEIVSLPAVGLGLSDPNSAECELFVLFLVNNLK